MSEDIRNQQILSKNDTGRPADSGKMTIQECGLKRPLPCIVIIVHGVNDVGVAFQNQDEGICAGLNDRLGRKDLHPHSWKDQEFAITDLNGNITQTCDIKKQTCIDKVNRSPVIPFYWGYRPVDKEAWQADQLRYRDELRKRKNDADLPYDGYRENEPQKIRQHNNANIDNFSNWLDPAGVKGGGLFANATTNIPDMFGPGMAGWTTSMVGGISRVSLLNEGDWSHPVYLNPHRIYQAYAARRLADLIITIRQNEQTRNDTINVIGHSQGTIITMLANMWVKAEGFEPADCVILNHSPYSVSSRIGAVIEKFSPGNQQTVRAREQTLINFCRLMATNATYNGGLPHDTAWIQQLDDSMCLHRNSQWSNPAFSRNNFGMVYNYFSPNDTVVSMEQIQGFGWSGIDDTLRAKLGKNFQQRVFCRNTMVGEQSGQPFIFDKKIHTTGLMGIHNAKYDFEGITVNAPILPVPFRFIGHGENNPEPYHTKLDKIDIEIAKAAMANEVFIPLTAPLPQEPVFNSLDSGDYITGTQLMRIQEHYPEHKLVSGIAAIMIPGASKPTHVVLQRRMTDAELTEAVTDKRNNITFNQHSGIVANPDVPRKAMAYDLAIGQCVAFEHKDFWDNLLLRADWRRPGNPDSDTCKYYAEGIFPKGIKDQMNKPEAGEKPMPTGKYGVLNDYDAIRTVKYPFRVPYGAKNIDISQTQFTTELQWPMPDPKV